MSIADLQQWLLDEGIRQDLELLTRQTVTTEIDNLIGNTETRSLEGFDWSRGVLAGSILARSEHRRHREAALRIATAAVTLAKKDAIKDAGAVLLGKLANFRAVGLAAKRHFTAGNLESRLGVTLRIEAQRRTVEHSVLLESSGAWLQVNEFQQQFWRAASEYRWLSASAPTASGKTFLVLQWLIEQMRATDARTAVYLAPTRALVSEIERSFHEMLGSGSGIEVSALPLTDKYRAARDGGAKVILVYTQERLHLLANALREDVNIDILVVDEAQKIGDSQRGVILQDAVERAQRGNPTLRVVFLSPASENPEELLADAPAAASSAGIASDAPTVLQNLILAQQMPGRPKLWKLTLRHNDRELPVGILELASSPQGLRKRVAFIAAAAGERGGTLVYANGAGEAEAIADLICQLRPRPELADAELAALADLARKGVHPKFKLAALVEKGVAFHYGNLPALIRSEIERLFRTGKIRFLVCTSTLIEGVNLSCRTIILRGPRKGMGNPMEPQDLWNLAGRAGRWGDEFQGNIICIDPDDRDAWPLGVPNRARYPIKRESDAVLEGGESMVTFLERRAATPPSSLEKSDRLEQVGAYLLATYLRAGTVKEAGFAKRHPDWVVGRLEATLAGVAGQVEVSAESAARHPGVSAFGLQRLLDAFRAYEGDVENLLPAGVASDDSYDRFVTILRRINEHVYPAFQPAGLVPLHALIVVQWLKGMSLAAIIRKNIEFHEKTRRPYKLAVLIRDTMEKIEQTARFLAPKYLAAYVEVLNSFLRERGRDELIEKDLDIGTQLEFGVSSKTLLSLMELGLSRMSAVSLFEQIARDDMTKEACREWVAERIDRLEEMDLPAIIRREIREKLLPPETLGGQSVSKWPKG